MTIRARAIIAARRRSGAPENFTGSTLGVVLGGTAWDWRADAAVAAERRGTQLANYGRLGATFVRFDLDWPAIQPTNATTYDWAYFDTIINDIVAHGLKPLPIFHRAPSWAAVPAITDSFGRTADSNGTSYQSSYPANMSQFATFCAAAVTRYKDRVKHWEVWNEPNLHGFWWPTPNAVQFANMLKAVYPAVKAVDPSCVVILGGLSSAPADDTDPLTLAHPFPEHKGEHGFLEAVYANGAGSSFDHVGIHPYSWPLMPSDPAFYNGWQMMSVTSPSVRSIMVANGDSAKKIWMTEFGGPTGTGPGAVSDQFLADMVTEAHTLAAGYPWAGPVIYYEYWDHADSIADTESNFGLVTHTYLPKLAYNAYLKIKTPASVAVGRTIRQGLNSYASAVDTRVNQAAATTSYGTATTLITGGDTTTTDKSQVLLRFDSLIGAGSNQIPAGATVVAAEVQLTLTTEGHGPSFHRMLQTWAATDTWNSRTAGVARDGVEATNNTLAVDYWVTPGVHRASVTSDVQAWVNGASNFGWLIEGSREAFLTFESSDSATAANRPTLLVHYIV
jgi:hypothetical protein